MNGENKMMRMCAGGGQNADKCPYASKARNGKIEFFRFLFSIAILLFHLGKYIFGEAKCGEGIRLSLFVHGSIGVEFFFLVSGYLMAKSADRFLGKALYNNQSIAAETWRFILSKYKGIWFYHLIAFGPTLAVYCIVNAKDIVDVIRIVLESLPSLFLLQMSGIKCISPNHIEWYLSAMIITMFLIYPILIRYGKAFSQIWAPLGGFLIVGYLSQTTGRLTGVSVWMGIAYKSIFRAVADLLLGVSAYELSQYLNAKNLSRNVKMLLSVVEYSCYGFVCVFMLLTLDHKYEMYALAALFVAVTVSFSNISYASDFFSNKLFYWLGELSLPIYVSQVFVITIITEYLMRYSRYLLVAGGCVAVMILSVAIDWLYRIMHRKG